MKKTKTYVIVGNSAAGLAAIESLRQTDRDSKIINISREPYRPYSRCLLSYYLAGLISKDRLWIRKDDYYQEYNVESYLGTVVEEIDARNKKLKVKLAGKSQIVDYDKLLLATGASPKRVNITGEDKKGVFYLRTLDDAEAMLSILDGVLDVAILGGGLIGMRAAYSLKKRNKNVHVLVKSSHIFSQMLDSESADILRRHLENNGIKISTGVEAKEIQGNGKVSGITLDDRSKLSCQMVIMGKGVAANFALLKEQVETKEGVLVDKHLLSNLPDIYAAGDVAQTYDILEEKKIINAIWPAAVRQGKVAGMNMAGKESDYEGSYGMNSVDFFGLSVISFGMVKPPKDDRFEELVGAEFNHNIYRKVVLKDKRIVGAILVNDIERHGILLHLAVQKIDVSDIKDLLVDEFFDYAKIMPIIKRKANKFPRPEYPDTIFTYKTDQTD